MIKFINFLVSKMKKEEFEVDSNLSIQDIISICYMRVSMLIRGNVFQIIKFKKFKVIFIDKNVRIVGKSKVSFGNSVTLNRNVEINAISKEGITIGNNVSIGAYSKIQCSGTIKNLGKGLRIGDNCGVGEFSYFGAAGGIKIGDNVIMGQNVRFHSENHMFNQIDKPIREQGVTNLGIDIEEDCWIGAGCVFLDGIKVGKGCVIGANTLVNKNIPPYSIAVGNPVKVIKSRLGESINENITL